MGVEIRQARYANAATATAPPATSSTPARGKRDSASRTVTQEERGQERARPR